MTIITISRFTMSGGKALADCLSEKLGIPSVSGEVIGQVAGQLGISEKVLWDKLAKTREGASPERNLYLAALQLALAERVKQGAFVYHGFAGHFLLSGVPGVLRIGIVAPLKMRAERLMREKSVTLTEATRSIRRWDESRSKWVRLLYDVEWLDPSLYDMVINIGSVSIESACETVMDVLNRREFKDSPGKERLIEDFVLASRVKAQLAINERTRGLELEVKAENGRVAITGRVMTGGVFNCRGDEKARAEIVRVAESVTGVQGVSVSLEEVAISLVPF